MTPPKPDDTTAVVAVDNGEDLVWLVFCEEDNDSDDDEDVPDDLNKSDVVDFGSPAAEIFAAGTK